MNRITSVVTLSIVALFSCVGILAQQEGSRPVIGIKAFENPPNYANSTIGTGLSDLFTTELMKTGKYKIVEREALGELMGEIDLGQSDYGEKKSAVPKGHFKGLEYLFVAKVTNFGQKERKGGIGGIGGKIGGGLGLRKSEAHVRLDFRIVDATTREVVYAGSGEGSDKTSGVALLGGALGSGGGAFNASDSSFLESQVGRATMKAIQDVIQKMDHNFLARRTPGKTEVKSEESIAQADAEAAIQSAPGKILAVVNNQLIIVSLGSEHGLKIGDKLNVFKQENVTDSKGKAVYTEERPIGVLTVTEVQPDRSKAAASSGSGFAERHIVRKQ